MKITIVLLLFAYASPAQVKITEVKMKFGSEFHKAKDPDIIFPVISAADKNVEKKINNAILFGLTNVDSTESISKTLLQQMNDGLSELDYDISLNTKDILSLRLNALGCGAYCNSYNIYFNFDLHTGNELSIGDVINNVDSFGTIVLKDKMKALANDKKQKDSLLATKDIDSSTYEFVTDYVQQNCVGKSDIHEFLLYPDYVEIIDRCEFPHVALALEPIYELKYPFRKIKKLITPSFAEKLKTITD